MQNINWKHVFGVLALVTCVLVKPALAVPQDTAMNVTVPVRVTDSLGRYVSGLNEEHFRILEDGVEQQISGFEPSVWRQSSATSIVILSNASGSAERGAIPQDALAALTRSSDADDELVSMRFEAKTLLDSVRTAIEQARLTRNPRKAIVIVSEGSNAAVVYDEMETKAVAAAADMPIYSLSAFSNAATAATLDYLAFNTGGRHFRISDLADLRQSSDIATKISVALRNVYILKFQSTNSARDGRFRTIDVELMPPRGIRSLQSDYRAGYYAPGQPQRN